MNPSRRQVIGAGAALAMPAWMARAFGPQDESAQDDSRVPDYDAALEHARSVGKPLLFVFTDPAEKVASPGELWGEFFANATEEVWLDLALVEVVCLNREVLGRLAQDPDAGPRWAVLIETDGAEELLRPIEGPLPHIGSLPRDAAGEARVRERAAALAVLLHAAILPNGDAPERRCEQSLLALKNEPAQRLGSGLGGQLEATLGDSEPVRLVDLDRFAATVRFRGEPARLQTLAMAARVRLFEHDPSGARWTTRSSWCPPCGMAVVPPVSRYFLEFYTQ